MFDAYFKSEGRIGRGTFLKRYLVLSVVSMLVVSGAVCLGFALAGNSMRPQDGKVLFTRVSVPVEVLCCWSFGCLVSQRLRDAGKSEFKTSLWAGGSLIIAGAYLVSALLPQVQGKVGVMSAIYEISLLLLSGIFARTDKFSSPSSLASA